MLVRVTLDALDVETSFDDRVEMSTIWFSTETDSKLTTELSPFSSYIPECDA